MPVPPYTIYQQPNSSGTTLAGKGFLRAGSQSISILRVIEQDIFTRA